MKRIALLLSLLALLAATPLRAQDQPKPDAPRPAENARPRTVTWYRVDVTLTEFDDGKKINARHYSVHINDSGDRSVSKFGSRVPIPIGNGAPGFNYLDVGLEMNLRIVGERGEHNILEMGFELSSAALADLSEQERKTAAPVVRRVQTSNSLPLVTGKSIAVASLDDPNSTKKYQFDVMLTKL